MMKQRCSFYDAMGITDNIRSGNIPSAGIQRHSDPDLFSLSDTQTGYWVTDKNCIGGCSHMKIRSVGFSDLLKNACFHIFTPAADQIITGWEGSVKRKSELDNLAKECEK